MRETFDDTSLFQQSSIITVEPPPQGFDYEEFFAQPRIRASDEFIERVIRPEMSELFMPKKHVLTMHQLGRPWPFAKIEERLPAPIGAVQLWAPCLLVKQHIDYDDGELSEAEHLNIFWCDEAFTVSHDERLGLWEFAMPRPDLELEEFDRVFPGN
ncbi:MAG TPA: hypothetical protein VFY28_00855 [Candidatus Paceibacterota bacterium]|nr:hypothetical protein [Candidatus Paceibacterota bacterium]